MSGSFFYVILTAHYIKYGDDLTQVLGYGITTNPKKRSKQYSDHTGIEQEFCYLYFGPTLHIKALESIVKQRVASKAHKIYGQEVEWINPKHNVSVDDMVRLVRDTIFEESFDIRLLKDDYLPFNNLDHHRKITVKELNTNPELYLVSRLVDKKLKIVV